MTTLALHIDHRLAPGSDSAAATAIGKLLARPCFAVLSRVAVNSKDRDKKHQPKTPAAITECLLSRDSDAAVLDNGRGGDLVAAARIWTGRHIATYDEPKPFLASYMIVPYMTAQRDAVLEAFADLAAALAAVAGYVAVERDYAQAHDAVLSRSPRKDAVRDYPRRARERKAHDWYEKQVHAQVSGPEWGLILGPEHMHRVELSPDVFPIVRSAGAAKLAYLSTNPEDALTEEFDARLDAARAALAPVLMDVASVPV